MEAIILAGGLGTRLRKTIPNLPKPMAPVAGRPFLEILLQDLSVKGFKHVVLSLGYMAEKVSLHFGGQFADMRMTYVVEDSPLGTGGGVRLAMTQCNAEHTYIFNGDTFLDLDVALVEKFWSEHRKPIIIGRNVPDAARYGRLLIDGSKITGFTEKGTGGPGLINAGCYVLNRGQLSEYAAHSIFSLETDYFSYAVKKQEFNVFITNCYFIDIGVHEDYMRAQLDLAV